MKPIEQRATLTDLSVKTRPRSYDLTDCIGALQIAAVYTETPVTDLTVGAFRESGARPTYQTINGIVRSWQKLKQQADERPQVVLPYYTASAHSVMSLRLLRDCSGYPVVSPDYTMYNGRHSELLADYTTVVDTFGSWTAAKRAAYVDSLDNALVDEPLKIEKSFC